MRGFATASPIPNMAHPINQGKVAWLSSINGDGGRIDDLIGQTRINFPRSAGGVRTVGGPARPGALGPAYRLEPTATPVNFSNSVPGMNRLSAGLAGFSVGIWVHPLSTASSGTLLTKGTVIASASGTGWLSYLGAGQRPVFQLGRATSRDEWATTNTTLLTVRTWYRIVWSWFPPIGRAPVCYVNGIPAPLTQTQSGSGAVNPESVTVLYWGINTGGTERFPGWLEDACLWNKALNDAEAWADYQESSQGYPGALLWQKHRWGEPEVVGGAVAFVEGIALGADVGLGPEVRKGIGLGVNFSNYPESFDTMTQGLALGTSMQNEGDFLPKIITSGFGLGTSLDLGLELRQGFALGSATPFLLSDPEANVNQGFSLGSRLRSTSGDLANGRYRR